MPSELLGAGPQVGGREGAFEEAVTKPGMMISQSAGLLRRAEGRGAFL